MAGQSAKRVFMQMTRPSIVSENVFKMDAWGICAKTRFALLPAHDDIGSGEQKNAAG
jgi:hypothetical protein